MTKLNKSADEAMDILDVPIKERENLKIEETASLLSFQRFMEFGYFGLHFSVTRSKAA